MIREKRAEKMNCSQITRWLRQTHPAKEYGKNEWHVNDITRLCKDTELPEMLGKEHILYGDGRPAPCFGKEYRMYIDRIKSEVYMKNIFGNWPLTGTPLTGPAGPPPPPQTFHDSRCSKINCS